MPTPTNPTPEGWPWPIEPLGETTGSIRSTPDGRLIETRTPPSIRLKAGLNNLPLADALDLMRTIDTEDMPFTSADLLGEAAELIAHLADLLDGVLADDPQAIRDAAAWLTVNRPAVPGGVGVRWLDSDGDGEGEGEGER